MADLRFVPFSSEVELPFYVSLASQKVNLHRLDDSARRVLGLYEIRPSENAGASCRMQLHGNALSSDAPPAGLYRAEGNIRNMNTIEDYRSLDKGALLSRVGSTVRDAIKDGSIFECPSLLASFVMLCFADLKKYKFTYHFGFPALHSEPSWLFETGQGPVSSSASSQGGRFRLSSHESATLVESVQTWRYSVDSRQHGFFLARRSVSVNTTPRGLMVSVPCDPPAQPNPGSEPETKWEIESLGHFETGFFTATSPADQFICFADPSKDPEHPGWMLRNLLFLVQQRWNLVSAQILCYRESQARRYEPQSMVLQVKVPSKAQQRPSTSALPADTLLQPKVTGWERNAGRLASKVVNLADYMDPRRLANQAADLNLRLMKWRIAPALDLDRLKSSRCLLLGAGTLGSYVARSLLAWGFNKITFVDNGKVSFSNPVRQPLYRHEDCLNGGVEKASRAAGALASVHPSVDSSGHAISIPMVGHAIADENQVKADFLRLQQLFEEHDVIFLLTDTRESRWLPTLLGKAMNKLVMNAALGFDTYVVMRHGAAEVRSPEQDLGCYFCNDVVAPTDSTANRTLDQQCTVTRPGVASIAASLLVEMTVSVLQHPDQALAAAPAHGESDIGEHPLGTVPHQIRGFLSRFQNIVIRGKSYDCCCACSDVVREAYDQHGWEFIKRALIEKGYVEELSGLAEVQRAAEAVAASVELDEDEISQHQDTESDGELI